MAIQINELIIKADISHKDSPGVLDERAVEIAVRKQMQKISKENSDKKNER